MEFIAKVALERRFTVALYNVPTNILVLRKLQTITV